MLVPNSKQSMPLLPTITCRPFGMPPMARHSYNTSSSVTTTGPQPLCNLLIGMLTVWPSTDNSINAFTWWSSFMIFCQQMTTSADGNL
jgi:hypothetical protein